MDEMDFPVTPRVLRKTERREVLTHKEQLQCHRSPNQCDIWAANKLMIGLATMYSIYLKYPMIYMLVATSRYPLNRHSSGSRPLARICWVAAFEGLSKSTM